MKSIALLFVLFFLVFGFRIQAQEHEQGLDAEIEMLAPYLQAINKFSRYIPQEKVYLHFDNTSYYQEDNIWFKCYVTSGQHQLSELSKTLYVELLNPGGEIVSTRILKIENGECHSEFTLNHLPFYSGFYEVRAYTKYMLNFGKDIIFSRLLPVFDKPKTENHYEEKGMLPYGKGNYPVKRAKPEHGKEVNIRFFPEGGNLVQGVTSRIAFEATDEAGNPIDIKGGIVDRDGRELFQFTTLHEGKGVFPYTPNAGKQEVVVDYSGQSHRFELPASLPQGIVMEVDNLSSPDSIGITLRKNSDTVTELLGVVLLNGGNMYNYLFAHIGEEGEVGFKMDKTRLSSGVSQIVVFNKSGDKICDRLIFIGSNEILNIHAKMSKQMYLPNELVDIEFAATDKYANPNRSTFSLSVRDGKDEVENRHNIMTDLLLMSEIKGYVRNPSWYFEEKDDTRSAALDLLLMVQGWRRYSWQQMAGTDPVEPKYLPEQGIRINGKVVSLVKQIPQANVDVSLFMHKKENGKDATFSDSFATDSLGRFSFTMDTHGKWNATMSTTEKGKPKDHLIQLDRLFSPVPQSYRYADLQVTIAGEDSRKLAYEEASDLSEEEDMESVIAAILDSLANVTDITEKIHKLPEITVRAKSREQNIYRNKSTSVAYYDVHSQLDNIYDSGVYLLGDIHQMLANMDKGFEITNYASVVQSASAPQTIFAVGDGVSFESSAMVTSFGEYLWYKGKKPLFVINYERQSKEDAGRYSLLNLSAIKSIFINEELSAMMNYCPPEMNMWQVVSTYSCVVFIETYPEEEIPANGGKGVRKALLDGYSPVKEFYSPNYSELPVEHDYRRTLYWNPAVTPDKNGVARIEFYNNSRTKSNFSISAETVTQGGLIGIYR